VKNQLSFIARVTGKHNVLIFTVHYIQHSEELFLLCWFSGENQLMSEREGTGGEEVLGTGLTGNIECGSIECLVALPD
jgi:hypothetical protein